MDIILIHPLNIKSHSFGITPPLGLSSIGCELEKSGFSVRILDLEIVPEDFDLYACLQTLSPKIVGISGTSHSRFESFRIAGIAKKVSPEIITVYGGCHASFTARDTLWHIKDIDYIVRGEGEVAMVDLARYLLLGKGKPEEIKGISFRKDKQVVENPASERITDLDNLCYSRHLLEMERYPVTLEMAGLPAATIMTARGCPYNCSFCSASMLFGKKYVKRSVKTIIDEIRYCSERFNIKAVRFFDSTLTLDRGYLLALTEALKRIRPLLPWHGEIRVDTVDEYLLSKMKESGCYSLDFGVESASEKVLVGIGKKITKRQVEDVVHWCHNLRIKTVAFFSFGHIQETWQDARETIDLMKRLYPYLSIISPIFGMRIYPGTRMERYALENGFLSENFSWSRNFQNIEQGPIATDNVPYLLQPQFGIKELIKCYNAFEKIQAGDLLTVANIIEKFKGVRSFADLLHKGYTALRLIKQATQR